MLTSATIVAQLATADLDAARAFYGGKLGFSSMLDSEQPSSAQVTGRKLRHRLQPSEPRSTGEYGRELPGGRYRGRGSRPPGEPPAA